MNSDDYSVIKTEYIFFIVIKERISLDCMRENVKTRISM